MPETRDERLRRLKIASSKRYRTKNRARVLEGKRKYREAHRGESAEYQRTYWVASKKRPIPMEKLRAAMERFEVAPSGCWLSLVRKTGSGYPVVILSGRRVYLHRAALEQKLGRELADHEQTRHSCDTPACINPQHLEAGTGADNMRDKVARGRQPRGEQANGSELKEAQVLEVRASGEALASLARRFGVSLSAVWSVRHRRTWRHV